MRPCVVVAQKKRAVGPPPFPLVTGVITSTAFGIALSFVSGATTLVTFFRRRAPHRLRAS
jgi:hypothetical protein